MRVIGRSTGRTGFTGYSTRRSIFGGYLNLSCANWNRKAVGNSGTHALRRGIKQIAIIIEAYHSCQPLTKFYPTSCCQGSSLMRRKFSGIISVVSDATGRLLIIYFVSAKYLREKMGTQGTSSSVLYRLQESLRFSYEGSLILDSH